MKKVRPIYLSDRLLISVFVSFSCGFALFAALNGGRFVKFVLAHIAYDTVARALSLETSERAFNRFVFAYSYR